MQYQCWWFSLVPCDVQRQEEDPCGRQPQQGDRRSPRNRAFDSPVTLRSQRCQSFRHFFRAPPSTSGALRHVCTVQSVTDWFHPRHSRRLVQFLELLDALGDIRVWANARRKIVQSWQNNHGNRPVFAGSGGRKSTRFGGRLFHPNLASHPRCHRVPGSSEIRRVST